MNRLFWFVFAFAFPSGSAFAIGNPASQNCLNLGGTVKIYQDTAGNQTGFCAFGQALVEEWSLYNGTYLKEHVMALDEYFSSVGPGFSPAAGVNPASAYCVAAGGQVSFLSDSGGNQIGVCQFVDGSAIEEFTLYRYTTNPANRQLTQVLEENYPYAP